MALRLVLRAERARPDRGQRSRRLAAELGGVDWTGVGGFSGGRGRGIGEAGALRGCSAQLALPTAGLPGAPHGKPSPASRRRRGRGVQ